MSNAHKQMTRRVISVNEIRVLDFGCGTGLLTEKIAPLVNEIVAIDSSPKMIEVLRKKPKAVTA